MKFVLFILGALLSRDATANPLCQSVYDWLGTLAVSHERKLAFFEGASPERIGESKDADNRAFVELMERPEASNLIFLHVTLKPLKELNDRVFVGNDTAGKNDVDNARDMFRVFFFDNLRRSPMLAPGLRAQFLNFKGGEPALDPSLMINPETRRPYGPSAIKKEIDRVWAESQIQFSSFMERLALENPVLLARIREQSGLVSDFRTWHLLGMAYGSPDVAAAAARQMGKKYNQTSGLPLTAHLFDENAAQTQLFKAERQNKSKLLRELGPDSPVFTRYENTPHVVLSMRAIDLLRKIKAKDLDSYIATVQARFRESLDTVLTPEQVIAIRDYYTTGDDFQPALRSLEQGKINLKDARRGALSIDFSGQNVVNMYHTLGAMAEANRLAQAGDPKGATRAIQLARVGEKLATARLQELREHFDEARKNAGIDGEYQITGDDGMVILKHVPTEAQQKALYLELKKRGATLGEYRIVWVPPLHQGSTLDRDAMGVESVKGETFEKQLREKLFVALKEKTGTDPYDRLKKSGISIELSPETRKVKVILATEDAVIKSVAEEVIADRRLLPAGYASSSLSLAF